MYRFISIWSDGESSINNGYFTDRVPTDTAVKELMSALATIPDEVRWDASYPRKDHPEYPTGQHITIYKRDNS